MNLRKIPHPQYGNYGGAFTRCVTSDIYKKTGRCPMPVDKLDIAFRQHDTDLANKVKYADAKLVWNLLRVNPAGKYKRSVYGRAYHVGATAVFALIAPFTAAKDVLT